MSFASPEDFTSRWPDTGTTTDKLQALLDDASVWLRVWYPSIPDFPESPLSDVLKLVSLQMVRRAVRAEALDGRESVSETAGPYSFTTKLSNPDGNLFLTSQEREGIEALLGARALTKRARGVQLGGW